MSSNVWATVSGILGLELGNDFESIARFWIANKRHKLTNIISSAVLWSIWKLRNETCFQGAVWMGMKSILLKIVRMLRRWMVLFGQDVGLQVEEFAGQLEFKASSPPRIQWRTEEETSSSSELEQSAARRSVSTSAALDRSDRLNICNNMEALAVLSSLRPQAMLAGPPDTL